MVNIISSGIDQ